MGEIVVACQDAAVVIDGIPNVLITGQTMADARHPIVRDYPGLWKPLDVHYAVDEPAAKAPAKTPPTAAPAARKQGAAQ